MTQKPKVAKSKHGAIVLSDKQEAWMVAHFKHTKNSEIAERFGISVRTVNRIAAHLGLTKTPQFMRKCLLETAAAANRSHRINGTYPPKGYKIPNSEKTRFKPGEKPIDRLGPKREAERLAKSAVSRRELFRLERARALYGLPRQTKLSVVKRPHKQALMRYYLRKKGYIIERGSTVAYYNSETIRSRELEERPMTGFTFLEQQ